MEQAKEMEWTDGVGKALSTLGLALTKAENERHPPEDKYTSNPMLMVIDLETGSTVLLQTETHTGGRTHGHGYIKESSYEQRIPMKVPMALQRNVMLDMIVSMLVPKEDDIVGPLGEAAYERIAEALKEGLEKSISTDKDLAKYWKMRYANHAKLIGEVSDRINDMTITQMKGKAIARMEAIPLTQAIVNPQAILDNIQEVVQDG